MIDMFGEAEESKDVVLDRVKRRHVRERVVILLDSLVARGAAAKGRSPSIPLNAELRKMVGDIIGYELYVGYHFTTTRLNPSDDPSRFVPVRPPRQPDPKWYEECADGDFGRSIRC